MKRILLMLFLGTSSISAAEKSNALEDFTFSAQGDTVEEALLKAVCDYSNTVKVFVNSSSPKVKGTNEILYGYTNMTSSQKLVNGDTSIDISCKTVLTSVCPENRQSCNRSDLISSTTDRLGIQVSFAGLNGSYLYTEKSITAPDKTVLLNHSSLKRPTEENACDINCLIKALYSTGLRVNDMDVTGSEEKI